MGCKFPKDKITGRNASEPISSFVTYCGSRSCGQMEKASEYGIRKRNRPIFSTGVAGAACNRRLIVQNGTTTWM